MWRITEVLEITHLGQTTGKWRLTTRLDDGSPPQGLCTHAHDSYDQAWNCVEAWQAVVKLSEDSS